MCISHESNPQLIPNHLWQTWIMNHQNREWKNNGEPCPLRTMEADTGLWWFTNLTSGSNLWAGGGLESCTSTGTSRCSNSSGESTPRNVVIITNMWGEVSKGTGKAQEKEIGYEGNVFQVCISQGCITETSRKHPSICLQNPPNHHQQPFTFAPNSTRTFN